MGKKEDKQIDRLKSKPKDYTFHEAEALVGRFGYKRSNRGRTSGSGVAFFRESDGRIIMLHEPHPGSVMKTYSVKDLLAHLIENGDINEE